MFHDKYKIKPVTNNVFYMPAMSFHQDIVKYLYDIGHDKELPNLLFYGGDGCGKHTLVDLLLYYIFGKSVFNMYVETYSVNSNNNTVNEINIRQSNNHMVIYPHNDNFDRRMIQYILKTFIQCNLTNKLKIIVINNVENLSYLAQMSLRRTMEEYSDRCRFIFVCKSISNIIDPLKSRCVAHRIENPTNEELKKCALNVLVNERITFTINDLNNIVKKANHNVKKLMLLLDLFSVGNDINDADNLKIYDNVINHIVKLIMNKHMYDLKNIKKSIYELIITNVPSSEIMHRIMKEIIKNTNDMKVVSEIIKCGVKHNKLLSNSRRDIIVFNSYVLNLMSCLG